MPLAVTWTDRSTKILGESHHDTPWRRIRKRAECFKCLFGASEANPSSSCLIKMWFDFGWAVGFEIEHSHLAGGQCNSTFLEHHGAHPSKLT
jgi:hypothetical protein